MAKTMTGTVVSTGMQETVIVEVTRKVPHPFYQKLLKQSKKFKVAIDGKTVKVGDRVTIVETKPMSKQKHFLLEKVL